MSKDPTVEEFVSASMNVSELLLMNTSVLLDSLTTSLTDTNIDIEDSTSNWTDSVVIVVLPPLLPSSECGIITTDYGLISAIICAIAFVIGILCCALGYRLFKATMLMTGFIFGSEIIYFVCVEEDVLPIGGKIGLSVGAGLLCGLTAVFFNYVGLFMTGFQLGLVLTVVGLIILEQFYHPFSKWLPIGLILGIALFCALIALRWQKGSTIFSSSAFGAALILVSIDYFVDSARVDTYAHDRLVGRQSMVTVCWYGWLIVAVWPLLTAIGVILQWKLTGANVDHRPSSQQPVLVAGRGPAVSGKASCRHLLQQTAGSSGAGGSGGDAENQQTHYRQLYQIRRVNGDVISRSYIQSVQQQQQQASQSQSLLMQGATFDTPSEDTALTLTAIGDMD